MKPGKWTNGKRTICGWWSYSWGSDIFRVLLDSKDRVTGQHRSFIVTGDAPEWGSWKLVRSVPIIA